MLGKLKNLEISESLNLKFFLLAALLLAVLLLFPSVQNAAGTPLDTFPKYIIKAQLNAEKLYVNGSVTILFRNKWNKAIDKLYFYLYPNAPDFRLAGGEAGITNIFVNGTPTEYTSGLIDGTVTELSLMKPLLPGENMNITILFWLKLPVKQDRYGYYSRLFALGNWYPIMATYDDQGWHLLPYYKDGESFYFEAALYEAYLKVPSNYIIAATGTLKSTKKIGMWKIEKWVTNLPVREFAWMASEDYNVISREAYINGRKIRVYSYYFDGHEPWGELALDSAIRSLEVFSKYFGPYPYSELRVCESYGWFGGMEYPMLVMIVERLYRPGRNKVLEMVVAHEVAHQWWYNIIGNNEGGEPFMDEAFAEYSGMLYFEFVYGKKEFEKQFTRFVRNPLYIYLDRRGRDYPLTLGVWEFEEPYAYYANIYEKGAFVLHYLRWIVGDEKFFEILKELYRNYKFRIIHIPDFINITENVLGKNMSWFFSHWLYSSGIPSFDVNASAEYLGGYYKVYIRVKDKNGINATYPVPISIVAEGINFEETVWIKNGSGEIELIVPIQPKNIVIDPYDVVPGKDPGSRTIEVIISYDFTVEIVRLVILLCLATIVLIKR